MDTKLLDIDTLEQLSFERSKVWAQFFETVAQVQSEEELDWDDYDDSLLHREKFDEDSDIGDSMESTSESDAYELSEILQNSAKMKESVMASRCKDATRSSGNHSMDTNATVQDLLNQTRPILEQHHRQWKEAGIDRVLDTFDSEKIEEKVGGWLRLNKKHSICNATMKPFCNATHCCNPSRATIHRVHHKRVNHISSDTESDSMHSMDTARYILSSKKCRRSATGCSMMSIKTYRLVESKREELRKKYACAENDEDHLAQIRSRRACIQDSYHKHSNRICSSSLKECYMGSHHRRKLLRKRRTHTAGFTSSSNESSSSDNGCRRTRTMKRQHCCCRGQNQKANKVGRECICYSPSTPSPHSYKSAHRDKKFDHRPFKRESDCRCCNEKLLCDEIRHLADTSTEKWIVENADTGPATGSATENIRCKEKKVNPPAEPRIEKSSKKAKIEGTDKLRNVRATDTIKRETHKIGGSSKKSDRENAQKEQTTAKKYNKDKALRSKKKTKSPKCEENYKSNELSGDSGFLRDIEVARQKSIETYEQEQKQGATRRLLGKIAEESDTQNSTRRQDNLEKTRPDAALNHSPDRALELTLKPQPKSAKMRKLAKLTKEACTKSAESTFFTPSKYMCNSTALCDDAARDQQLFNVAIYTTPKKKTEKRRPERNVSIVSPSSVHSSTFKEDEDCTIVTSTTDERSRTEKGILLYTPKHRHIVPEHSFVDGQFNITKEHLSAVIGEKPAKKFLKYYIGRKSFDCNSTVYYRPPQRPRVDTNADTDSGEDELEYVGQCGDLYESFEKDHSDL